MKGVVQRKSVGGVAVVEGGGENIGAGCRGGGGQLAVVDANICQTAPLPSTGAPLNLAKVLLSTPMPPTSQPRADRSPNRTGSGVCVEV